MLAASPRHPKKAIKYHKNHMEAIWKPYENHMNYCFLRELRLRDMKLESRSLGVVAGQIADCLGHRTSKTGTTCTRILEHRSSGVLDLHL